MRLPLRLEYACQILAQLARDGGSGGRGGGLRQVEELAAAEGISANYSVQILTSLRQAGLVLSQRGKRGGYRLAKAPEEITLAEIAAAMGEAPLLESSGGNEGASATAVREAWRRVEQAALACCEEIRLSELAPPPAAEPGGDWVI